MLGLITVSRTYLKKNQNMTLDRAIEQAIAAFRIADRAGIPFVQAIGMALWCAYEGAIPEDDVLALVRTFRAAGMRRFYVAGSVGMEDPRHVGRLISRIYEAHPDIEVGFHVHNLSGWGHANVLAALDAGAGWLEGSICGIGGGVTMPSALGSVGNLPTEDLVAMLDTMGVHTGLDPEAVVAAARDVAALLGITPRSHAGNGATRREVLHPAGAAAPVAA
jgi:hydroxymethylglutaryl-CoA lyase